METTTMRLAAAIVLELASVASAQVLTITVNDANTELSGQISSVCWVEPNTLECVCPELASDYYGEPAPEVAHMPTSSNCDPNWVPGLWATDVAVTDDGDIGVTQTISYQVPFAGVIASFNFTGTGTKPPGTPLKPFGYFGTTLYVAGDPINFGCAEQHPTETGFVLTFRMAGDHNQSGEIGVPDIFAFLSDWFVQSPRADYDTDGTVSVPDIFTFMSAWFAGA